MNYSNKTKNGAEAWVQRDGKIVSIIVMVCVVAVYITFSLFSIDT